ncbi:MAG TPA: hypothetical protein VIW92_00060 [Thermoanaerobaculia bacterium]
MTKQQAVSQDDPTAPLPVEPPTLSGLIRLKAERVEEKLSGEGGAKVAFSLELTADHLQPVTIELAEPRVTLILHGEPGW